MTEELGNQDPGETTQRYDADELRLAVARQHAAPKSPEEKAERSSWSQIRAAQVAGIGQKGNDDDT